MFFRFKFLYVLMFMSVSTTYSLDELDVLYLYSNSLSFSFFNVKTINYWFIVVILNIKLWYNFNDNITNPNMLYKKWRFILLFIYILENLFLIYLVYCIVISKTSYAKFTYIYRVEHEVIEDMGAIFTLFIECV